MYLLYIGNSRGGSISFKSRAKMSHDYNVQVHDGAQKEAVISTNAGETSESDLDPIAKSGLNAVLKATTWTLEEERKLLRRLDFYLIPLVMVMFFTLNLDR